MEGNFYAGENWITPTEAKDWIQDLGYELNQINNLPTSDTVRIMFEISQSDKPVNFNAEMQTLVALRDGYNTDL